LNSQGLYVVWVGANDFFLGLTRPATMNQVLADTISNIANSICKLGSFGARHFLVGNMPDIGLSPFAKQQGPGAPQLMSHVISQFNVALNQTLSNLPLACAETIDVFD
ncbi:MAG: hypothetical protein GWN55_02515, partial [Phycisphaerae bacterium]|nr:hypothetical protein [Phycisphaerae bacterium]NIU23771.1 hypothetical protein [candidate division KSB1 bacterium]NIV00206.1 hypothetical protein [Phycisphaerae bacterium]NIV68677.1 hypothetical protein [Phycisphaerae bacterium]NIW17610.1 hypothetical protein [candidate division KSB1 bacterium]